MRISDCDTIALAARLVEEAFLETESAYRAASFVTRFLVEESRLPTRAELSRYSPPESRAWVETEIQSWFNQLSNREATPSVPQETETSTGRP